MNNYNRLMIRDCHGQVRAARRVILALQDDLGDLSVARDLPDETRAELAEMSDAVVELEAKLHAFQGRLADISSRS